MKRWFAPLAMPLLVCSSLVVLHTEIHAATIKLTDYWVSKGPGDVWTYGYTQPSGIPDFIVAITTVPSGTYAGKYRMGDYRKPDGSIVWRIVSWDANNLTMFYDNQHGAYEPPVTMPLSYELEKVLANPSNPTSGIWYFKKLPTLTVPAGTYSDILLKIDLDKNFGPNAGNILFGLPSSITYGVTHATWYARGVGELQDMDFDATGAAGATYQLKSTNATPPRKGLAWGTMFLLDN